MNYINPDAPAAGLTRLLNMRDNNPAMQLAYMPTKDIAAMDRMGAVEFNPYSGIPQARGVAAVAEGGSIDEAPLSPMADELASRGRYGDSMLLHVRPDELQGLASLGTLTINPDTGLPEAFSFKSLLPAVGAIGATFLLGPAGLGLLGGAGGSLIGGAFGTGVAAGLGSFAGGLIAGQSPGQAALGGLLSGATAGFFAGAPTGVDQITGGAGGSTLTDISGQGFVEGASQQAFQTTLPTTTASLTGTTAAGAAVPLSGAMTGGVPQSVTPIGVGVEGAVPRLGDFYPVPQSINQVQLPGAMTGGEYNYIPVVEKAMPFPSNPDDFISAITNDQGVVTGFKPSRYTSVVDEATNAASSYTAGAPRSITPEFSVDQMTASQLEKYPAGFATESRFATIDPSKYEAPNKFRQALGAEDFTGRDFITRQEFIDAGGRPADLTADEFAEATFTDPKTYAGAGITTLMQPPPPIEYEEPEPLEFGPSYVPRRRTLAGGQQRDPETTEQILARMISGGDAQPLARQFRYISEGGLVALQEGGVPPQGQPVVGSTVLEEQEKEISERARQDEIKERDRAMSRGQQFIQQPTGNEQLFQQMQVAGEAIGQQIAQGQQGYATPYGQKAPTESFNTGADFGFYQGGLIGLSEGGVVSLRRGGEPDQIEKALPITLQSTMGRLGIKDATPFLEFAQKTKQLESSGGINRINPNSSARGDFQWLTKVNPKAKKGAHGSVKTAVNRTIASYKRIGQDIPQWLKTLNKNSTKSTKDLEANVLSLTPDQELELFFGNIGEAEDSDKYLTEIAKGNQQAMFGAYSDIHHTRGQKDKSTRDMAIKTFFSDMPKQDEIPLAKVEQYTETMVDDRPSEMYTVQPGDTLSRLAARSGVSVDDLMAFNLSRISDPDKIYAGQQIALSDSPDIPNPVPVSEEEDDGLMNLIRNLLPSYIKRAEGGGIGGYFEGQVQGRGDGMSDQILFEVEGNNPDKALLSRDEYVIPADVVAMLGNGSSNAGSDQLDNFIKGIRQDSFGTQRQQRELNAQQGLRGLV